MERSAWRKKAGEVNGITPKFNVPRNCKTFETKKFFFVELGMYPKRRVAIPIKRNRDFQRFLSLLKTGWTCKTFGLTPRLDIVAFLSKEMEIRPRKNVLGIDINVKHFAATVISPEGKILHQTYFGEQIWPRKHRFMERRALFQSLNALKKLKRMRHDQRNFVETNIGQMVAEIIKIAIKHDADIAIENLSKFKPKGRKFNTKVMGLPFYKFRQILSNRCFDNGIALNKVDSYHTSKWCSHCGAVGNGHAKNYSLFRCKQCGLEENADRKASLAVAVKTLWERNSNSDQNWFQISHRRVPVSGLVRVSDAARPMAVPIEVRSRGKPTGLSRG